jgi:hypothetical protein
MLLTATTTTAVETTIKVKAANTMPIVFKARVSAIAKRLSTAEKSPVGVPTRAFPSLVNFA